MSKTNNFVFKALHIVAWLIFVGLCIEAGGLIVNFIFSLYKPEFIPNLYQKLDLTEMYKDSQTFILMGAVIYIIATIFKKGVDIQNENDLTV